MELVDYYNYMFINISVLPGPYTHHLAAAAATTTTTTTTTAVFPVHDFVCVLLHQWFA